jgi:Iron-sulfur cluster-binding domain
MSVIALIPTNMQAGFLGQSARLGDRLGAASVLEHTIRRAASISQVEKIVLIHPPGQDPLSLIDPSTIEKPLLTQMDPGCLADAQTPRWVSARKWTQPNWRGGLGGATCYDELLPPGPLIDALEAQGAEVAYVVRADWCLFDPGFAQQQIELLFQDVQAMKLIFTQAPPGLSGIAVSLDVLKQLREDNAAFGNILAYNPQHPHIDPIGRDVNSAIPPEVRDCAQRFIYDTPRGIEMIKTLADRLGDDFFIADALAVTDAFRAALADDPAMPYHRLPRMVTLELTPRRNAQGPITPQHHVAIERADIDTDLALRLVEQLGEPDAGGDITLLLGGLGDALLHPQWDRIVSAARDAGVLGVGIETDLLCDRDDLNKLLDLPIDLVIVRFNADTAETYRKAMGTDGFKQVLDNLEWLFNERHRRGQVETGQQRAKARLPWLVPSMVKTALTLPEMESFFDKWTHYMGHAVIAPSCQGCGLMPAMSPVPMQPPDRRPCRQIGARVSILSDGTAALCDQDWLGRAPIGDTKAQTLLDIWQGTQAVAQAHNEQRWDELSLCGGCVEWHRP